MTDFQNKKINRQKVGIIIVNWNKNEETIECLKSILKSKVDFLYSIILVDNGSHHKLRSELKRKIRSIPNLIFIESKKNLGFAGGNNLALKKGMSLGFDYFFLLNNDTIIDTKTLQVLIDTFRKSKNIGAVSPKMLFYSQSQKIWWAGGKIDLKYGRITNLGYGCDDHFHVNMIDCDYLTGCALMVKQEVVEKVGFLDTRYFHTAEDVDWSIRIRNKGYTLKMNPEAKIWHKVAISGGGDLSPFYLYYLERNRLLLMKKFGYWQPASVFRLIPLWIKRSLAALIKGKSIKALKSIFIAIIDFNQNIYGKSQRFT